MKFLNQREVEVIETGFDDGWIQIIQANYVDGEDLTEDEMVELETNYQDSLYEDYYSGQIDYAHDMLEDR